MVDILPACMKLKKGVSEMSFADLLADTTQGHDVKLGACIQGIGLNCQDCPLGQARRAEHGFGSGLYSESRPIDLFRLGTERMFSTTMVRCPTPWVWDSEYLP